MAMQQAHPRDVFSNTVATAKFLMERGEEKPFEKGARFTLIGKDGPERFVHSAKQLCEARDVIRSMAQLQGGQDVETAQRQSLPQELYKQPSVERV